LLAWSLRLLYHYALAVYPRDQLLQGLEGLTTVPPLKLTGEFKRIVKRFKDDLLDRMQDHEFNYDGDAESGQITLVLTAET
jgi:hypothetical protein